MPSKLPDDDPDTFRILVATDNHLGYLEKDPVRGNDSFDAFEEILQYARSLNVDMMVLGGDLFHDNKPSRKTLHTAMELLRHYCWGERECQMEFQSDPAQNFHSRFGTVNYQDGNLNVSLPVFAIHGNHDDPAGDGNLSAMDILSCAGLINYFGRVREVDDITLSPIILKRGSSKLALYGLGNIRDERLHRTFTARRVRMLRPATLMDGEPDHWFSLMLFHQNRTAHSPTNHIPEAFLGDSLDLVIWGHEHDCYIDPLYIPQRDFHVSQPGSSCITSLSEGEARQKHVALLTVKGCQFELSPLPLHSVRPFIFSDMTLGAQPGLSSASDAKTIHSVISNRIEEMLREAEERQSDRLQKKLPLIRLRIDYSGGFQPLNAQRIGQTFAEKVANPRDMILLTRKRNVSSAAQRGRIVVNEPENANDRTTAIRSVEDLVGDFLGAQKLDLLPQNEFTDSVKIFVEKDDRDAIEGFLKASLDRTINQIKDTGQLDSLREAIERIRLCREEEWRRLNPAGEAVINHRVTNTVERSVVDDNEETASNDDSEATRENVPQPVATRGRGRGRGRGRAATASASQTTTANAKRPAPLQLSAVPVEQDSVTILETRGSTSETPVKRSRWPLSRTQKK